MKEIYLGDGLYASFDGRIIRLRASWRTSGGWALTRRRNDGDHVVFLDPDVTHNLLDFISNLRAKSEGNANTA